MPITAEGRALDELAALAQKIYREHGLKIDGVDFEWIDVTHMGSERPDLKVVAARADMSVIV